jgi:aspartate kinase
MEEHGQAGADLIVEDRSKSRKAPKAVLSASIIMRQIIVQKYGGTSLATAAAIRRAARRVIATKQQGYSVVAVVSAIGHTTDRLLGLARKVTANPPHCELDVLLNTGEHASMSLLSMCIQGLGEDAVSMTGEQCGIITNDVHSNARILELRPRRIREELARGKIVVAAGFQGVTEEGQATTLGRGGSDTTAVALAAALGAERCEIYTDVDGVYSADPRIVQGARLLENLGMEEMQELAWHGAQIMKAEAVEFAGTNNVNVVVRSSLRSGSGTRIRSMRDGSVYTPQRRDVAGVSGRTDLMRLTTNGRGLDRPVFSEICDRISVYDLVFGGIGEVSNSFDLLISTQEITDPILFKSLLEEQFGELITVSINLGAVSLVGFGLGSRPRALMEALRLLDDEGIVTLKSFSGRESLTFVIPAPDVQLTMVAMHKAFVEDRHQPTY